jgi:hypothetical protein
MSHLIRVHDFVKLASKHGFDMWYDPKIRLWTLIDRDNNVVDYFTRAVLLKMGLNSFARVYLGV